MSKAIGMIEFKTTSTGVTAADAMVKTSEVEIVEAQTVCPGKYIAIITGDLSAVKAAVDTAVTTYEDKCIDSFVLGNPHESIFPAIYGTTQVEDISALGILETYDAASIIEAADQAAKTAIVDLIELRIAKGMCGKSYMMITGEVSAPDDYGISLQSPAGEKLYVSSSLGAGTQELSFIFVETKVLVNYVKMERMTGKQLIYFRFFHPAAGIWKVNVSKKGISGSRFHMWLPVQGLISPDTYFLESTPYITVTAPGDSTRGITATAYQYLDNSLYFQAGRGFTPNNQVTPDLAAPGVDLLIPLPGGAFGKASGSSLSSAVVAGAAALVQEWAIVRGNIPYASGNTVKFYLQKGAVREEQMEYPNPGWGYGRLDLYRTFEIIN